MIKFEIKSADVAESQGTFDDGKAWRSRKQTGYAIIPGKAYPVEVQIKLGQQAPYPPGYYDLSPESFNVYNGRLEIRRLVLVPRPAQAARAA